MTLTHVLTWVCGRPVWVWKLLTSTEAARLTHYTAAMVKLKAAKLAAGGALVACLGVGGYEIPRLAGGGPLWLGGGLTRMERVDVPEPGTWVLLLTGVVGLGVVRYRR